MRLVPVAAAELRHAQRQVAIGFDPLTEHLNMCWAVHRFQRLQVALAGKDWLVLFRVGHFIGHHEHIFALFAPMAGGLPQPRVHELRRLPRLSDCGVPFAAYILFHLTPQTIGWTSCWARGCTYGSISVG